MFKALRLALRYRDSLPLMVDLIETATAGVRDDGTISRRERAKLMKNFWALVKCVKDSHKDA